MPEEETFEDKMFDYLIADKVTGEVIWACRTSGKIAFENHTLDVKHDRLLLENRTEQGRAREVDHAKRKPKWKVDWVNKKLVRDVA